MTFKKIGRYRILELLGRGGMGEVYKAFDPKFKRYVAVKIIRSDLFDAEFEKAKKRMFWEGIASGRLFHENIISTLDMGDYQNLTYIVMEYVDGISLRKMLQQKGPFAIKDAIPILLQICKAMIKAHELDVIHRDLKPENVMILSDSHIKIADFGAAKVKNILSQDSTKPQEIIGTLNYLSPERISGRNDDHRSDIFSFGVMAYELLTGTPPFYDRDSAKVITNILNENPVPLRFFVPEATRELEYLINRCLEKMPAHRFQSFKDVMQALSVPSIMKHEKIRMPVRRLSPQASERTTEKTSTRTLIAKTKLVKKHKTRLMILESGDKIGAQMLDIKNTEVMQTENHKELIDLVRKKPPHCIIVDLQTPGIKKAALQSIQKTVQDTKIPIIFIGLESKAIGPFKYQLRKGIDLYLEKPLSRKEFAGIVDRFVTKNRLLRAQIGSTAESERRKIKESSKEFTKKEIKEKTVSKKSIVIDELLRNRRYVEAIKEIRAIRGKSSGKDLDQEINRVVKRILKDHAYEEKNVQDYRNAVLKVADNLYSKAQFEDALQLYEVYTALKPRDTKIKNKCQEIQKLLMDGLMAYIGSPKKIPKTIMEKSELLKMKLSRDQGFLVTQIDGKTSIEDLVKVFGKGKYETYKVILNLVQKKVISI